MAAAEAAIGPRQPASVNEKGYAGKRHRRGVEVRYPKYGKESRPVDRKRDSMAGHVMTG